jgi:hypothetical protein
VGSWSPEAVDQSGAGARSAGSRIVATSTPVSVLVSNRAPGSPSATRCGEEDGRCRQVSRSRSTITSRSWSGSPRSMSPRRRGWCAPVRPTRPRWASGLPRSGRWARPPTRSWSWPSSWSARDRAGGGGVDVRLLAAVCVAAGGAGLVVWLVNARDAEHLPGRPRPTSWMRCGGASATSGQAAALVRPACPDPPAAGATPGCAPT